jgi:guanylate kinase
VSVPYINDINNSLIELNSLIEKNYLLRDTYYTMEQNIQKSLATYYNVLRDYQYDIDIKIKQIINNVKNIINEPIVKNNYDIILETFSDKKTLPIITKLLDIIKIKKWEINIKDTTNWVIMYKDTTICTVVIQLKKIIVIHNQIELTFITNKDNQQNFEIIKLL